MYNVVMIRNCFLIFIVACFSISCSLIEGDDGTDGTLQLAIDWIEQPVYYTDTNPAIPENLVRKQFYESLPGSYSFAYAFDDEFGWEGFYELKEAEPGSAGKPLWKDGEDGRNAFYTLLLSYHGTEIENYYEKRANSREFFTTEAIVGGFIITIHKQKVRLNSPFDENKNKLSGE